MNLLIIGGTGLLGTSLIATAAHHGHRVTATFCHRPPPSASPARWSALDMTDDAACNELVADSSFDTVINAAYVPGGPALQATTERAPAILAAAASAAGVEFVQVSTDVVFGGRADRAYLESDAADPVHAYGTAKANAERAVCTAHPGATVVRTSLLYGGDEPHTQEGLVRRAASVGDIAFYTDEVRSPVAVGDVSRSLLGLIGRSGIWHVTGSDAVDRLTFARLLAPHLGIEPSKLRGSTIDPDGPPRPAHVVLDCTKAAAVGVTAPGVFSRLG